MPTSRRPTEQRPAPQAQEMPPLTITPAARKPHLQAGASDLDAPPTWAGSSTAEQEQAERFGFEPRHSSSGRALTSLQDACSTPARPPAPPRGMQDLSASSGCQSVGTTPTQGNPAPVGAGTVTRASGAWHDVHPRSFLARTGRTHPQAPHPPRVSRKPVTFLLVASGQSNGGVPPFRWTDSSLS